MVRLLQTLEILTMDYENNIEKRDIKGYHGREILELLICFHHSQKEIHSVGVLLA